jgi:O-antigen/teichoic acid export membrane protein
MGSAGLGAVFWAVASRTYSPEVVGRSTAAVSALMFLAGVAGLNLDAALFRFMPRAGDAAGRLFLWTVGITVVGAMVATGIFLAGLDLWAPALSFARSSPWFVIASVGATIFYALLVVEDGALTGLRRAGWVPIKNVVYSAVEIPLLVAFVGAFPKYGILAAWVFPTAVIAPIVAYVIGKQLVPRHRELTRVRHEAFTAREVQKYAVGNYAASLCSLAYRMLPPLVVLYEAGAKASAFFYPPWVIATSLALLTTNVGISLVVEGSYDRDRLASHARQAVVQTARLLLPLAAITFFGATYILRIFGPGYADHGSTLLRLLAIGLAPTSVCVLAFALARVLDQLRVLIASQAAVAVLVLGLSAAFVPRLGINGVGVAWLAGQTAVAAILFVMCVRPALRGGYGG